MSSPKSSPSVSVCIPVYNGRRFLAATIDSVLAQTWRDFELVVLDNHSSDGSADVARGFDDPRIRVERNPATLPLPQNWNRTVELGRAPLVKLLCADDLLQPRCLELQVPPMLADPGVTLVSGRRDMIDEYGRVIAPRRGLAGLTGPRSGAEVGRRVVRNGANPIGEPGGALFRRDTFLAVGGFRAQRDLIMDLDLWMRLLRRGGFVGCAETLAAFRIGGSTLSAVHEERMYHQQRDLTREVSQTTDFAVRRRDAVVGHLLAPAGRARRRALFAASRMSARVAH
jgi:glycosyltransferase involved in cell wall biosynthesis